MTSIKSEILIDANILRKNIKTIKNKLQKKSKFMAVIKSDAYGHNLSSIVKDIDDLVDGYGVVRIEEALEIRKQSNKKVLLMQGVYSKEEYILSKNQKLDLVIHNNNQFNLIKDEGNHEMFWYKVNTGMNRLGIAIDELDQFQSLLKDSNVLMTHLACADDPKDKLNNIQFENFDHAWNHLENNIQRSILNSAGVFNFPDKAYDWVRPGIAMYGGIDFPGLKTAMTFRSQIISIQFLDRNERIGYGGRVETKKPSKIAIVYCGYADGFPQTAIDGTSVIVNSYQSKIIGRVSMDLISIDITDIPDCKIGDWCELWSPDLSIVENANKNNLISYELMTKISARVTRKYLNL